MKDDECSGECRVFAAYGKSIITIYNYQLGLQFRPQFAQAVIYDSNPYNFGKKVTV
jgi:hypothetical protein